MVTSMKPANTTEFWNYFVPFFFAFFCWWDEMKQTIVMTVLIDEPTTTVTKQETEQSMPQNKVLV